MFHIKNTALLFTIMLVFSFNAFKHLTQRSDVSDIRFTHMPSFPKKKKERKKEEE